MQGRAYRGLNAKKAGIFEATGGLMEALAVGRALDESQSQRGAVSEYQGQATLPGRSEPIGSSSQQAERLG
jgi:hypothetical protein